MSKKKIIGIIALIVFGIVNTVLYLIFKDEYLDVLKQAYNLLNEPLPIVGITAASVFVFLWQVLVRSRYGRGQINAIERKYKEKSESYEATIEKQNKLISLQDAKIVKLESHLVKALNVMPNKKVKAIGKEIEKESFYGEKGIDSETKAN